MRKSITNLRDGKKEFILDCKIRNLADATIKSYNECFNYFIEYMENNYNNLNIKKEVNRPLFYSYLIPASLNLLNTSSIL